MFHIRSLRLWLCAAIVLSSVFIWGRAPKTVNAEGSLFTVISTDDGVDAAGCDATHCSLREAIIAANAATEGAIIQFAIPNTDAGCTEGGVCTIALTSPLPDITQAGIVINGYSQPGASVNTLADQDNAALKIVVDGSALSADMLTIKADGCTVRGLVIGGTSNSAISILGSSNTIEGNFIGADVEGNGVLPNGTGITIGDGSSATLFQGNTIGGDTPAERNVISGNLNAGIEIQAAATKISGNFIGLADDGTNALANRLFGVRIIAGEGNIIGGPTSAERNVISGNGGDGILLSSSSGRTIVRGNTIGMDAAGASALPNQANGIRSETNNTNTNIIGGTQSGQGNLIAGNAGSGVMVVVPYGSNSNSNTILRNAIYDNGGLASTWAATA